MPILALLTSSLAAMSNPSKILSSISRFYLDSYEVCLLEFTSLVLYGMPETKESVFHGLRGRVVGLRVGEMNDYFLYVLRRLL